VIETVSQVDFGEARPGEESARSVRLDNLGGLACALSGIAVAPDSDVAFAISSETATSLVVPAGGHVVLGLTFRPESVSIPLERAGELVVGVEAASANKRRVIVPLTARIRSDCSLEISPPRVDFGRVPLGASVAESISLVNRGISPCEFGNVHFPAGSDPEFFFPQQEAGLVSLEPGQMASIRVGFGSTDARPPHHRETNVGFATTDPGEGSVGVPISADIDVGCNLTWTPTQLDFGVVILNAEVSSVVTLGNDGTDSCLVSGLDLEPGSDRDFSLDGSQSRSLSVAPTANVAVRVLFRADSSLPHLKTGALIFQTGNRRNPDVRIPLSAYVSTSCVEASRWIFAVTRQGMLTRFDPSTLTLTDIGKLDCPSADIPNSMAVDQNATAWIGYMDGNLFKADANTANCQATGFVKDQHGLHVFGMGFMFDPSTGVDTLYLSGGADNRGGAESLFATLSLPSLVVTPIGNIIDGNAELTGTGDGELWGFVPDFANASRTKISMLSRIDPSSGKTLESHFYPSVTASANGANSWAMTFWGGSFWIFLNGSIYEVSRDTPDTIKTVLTNTDYQILGAGVSTCAPLK
jgi:hypothetical protein